MQQTYKTIEDDIIEDITEETLLSLDELDAGTEEALAEAKCKKEDEDEDADDEDDLAEADKPEKRLSVTMDTTYDPKGEGWLKYMQNAKAKGITATHKGSRGNTNEFNISGPFSKVRAAVIAHYGDTEEAEDIHPEIKKKTNESYDFAEALDSVGKEDDDVDNDGDSDETDEYLKNRRKKIAAAVKKQNEDVVPLEKQIPDYDTLSLDQLWDIHADYSFDDGSVTPEDKTWSKKEAQKLVDFIKGKFGNDVADDMCKASELSSYAGATSVDRSDIARLRKKHNVIGIDAVEEQLAVDSSDITRLVESEVGLTEEFKEKATLIFETAVRTKVAETEAVLKEEYATRLAEEVESIQEDLVEKIDSYLTYAVESWVADNKVAVESTLRTEIAENFISSLKSVFVENYIDVPEGKTDLVAEMETKLTESQEQATKLERIAESLAEKVETLSRANVLAETSRDLADTQVAKLQSLAEDVEYVDTDSFRKKVQTLKEFYINSSQAEAEETIEESSYISTETIVENETFGEEVSPSMQNYLTAISRLNNASTANLVG